MMKKRHIIIACCMGLTFGATINNSFAIDKDSIFAVNRTDTSALVMDDRTFIEKAAQSNLYEIELSKLAVKNTSDADVKKFAEMVIKEHTKANDNLKKIAMTKKITFPTSSGEEYMKKVTELKKKTGTEFDKSYLNMVVKNHNSDESLYEKSSKDLKDPELKSYASTTLKTVKMHNSEAKDLETQISSTSSTKKSKSSEESENPMQEEQKGSNY